MFIEKLKPIIKGYIKALVFRAEVQDRTGGTDEAEYCYSTWLRHLIKKNEKIKGVPKSVLELGPGDSLGIGIAALLSGADHYTGLDIRKYWNAQTNVEMFDKLVALFQAKARLADEKQYQMLAPYLENYDFPEAILTDVSLQHSLEPSRLAAIRAELGGAVSTEKFIKFSSPWRTEDVAGGSIDFVFSQAVLQYTDLTQIYSSIESWLKPGGLTAHVIDFSSHGITETWNGHWAFSNSEWNHYSFKKEIVLNRAPFELHKSLLEKHNFEVILVNKYFKENRLNVNQLGQPFKNMTKEDLTTRAAYMLSMKRTV